MSKCRSAGSRLERIARSYRGPCSVRCARIDGTHGEYRTSSPAALQTRRFFSSLQMIGEESNVQVHPLQQRQQSIHSHGP